MTEYCDEASGQDRCNRDSQYKGEVANPTLRSRNIKHGLEVNGKVIEKQEEASSKEEYTRTSGVSNFLIKNILTANGEICAVWRKVGSKPTEGKSKLEREREVKSKEPMLLTIPFQQRPCDLSGDGRQQ